mmetsp:Transcript_30815/g.39699  ORF Transcript_30815/g.39699 Transcript_30815/m.39699 type:complete len:128 (-) Transcript_30815:5913-6296(-)
MIKEVDITNDGQINFVEFCTMIKSRDKAVHDIELEDIFDKFDGKSNMIKNGSMSKADLSLAFNSLNVPTDDSEIDQIFESVGLIDNMGMSKAQFCKLFRVGEGFQGLSPLKAPRPKQPQNEEEEDYP